MSTRGVRRFVKDLLRRRRPRPFAATAGDEAELRTAVLLRAARPGAGAASEEFVTGLHRRLAQELGEPAPAPGGTRRRFIQVSSAAVAAAAGAGVEYLVTSDAQQAAAPPPPEETLRPENGEWRAVVAAHDLPEGGVLPFDFGAVAGFVQRSGGQVRAVSATCTHLGCRLNLDAPARRLNCPCHRTSFAVDGVVLTHQLPVTPPPLPHLVVREAGGVVEVLVPPAGA
ncbi:rieske (2Fe-2S) domain-containing protein [Amycolatopsis mediterranei S699]|uniref:Rieske (2Fe-2S) domain-containing protein n=3 Tax=Amycolatopsis mediterranei TaxID=33910 RepID=A0A0H3D3I7_AMYMU|nr:Rieske (2Fe-2S) protein [Amycolatopsis mediterranei]ADJ45540.1 rieske (2Fe-2S) domain-containing protein [Amycolatopsis mediterranei U32]AEK42316.1 rieske (2Fe-2S) domain-containing protein [Amycolatopsis mediterranei S699]AFO77252.1 rieske (2Fe-2S) domain-containing protein [Amycolatopsis mediterranei S699]AGT84380.1 rieske (2Fe-2S) domain-containing protein [Amycolatopsis mediterranei RB]KDO05798.1 2Fe-2S ferredoxin [Amycolatopsis mediterranei]